MLRGLGGGFFDDRDPRTFATGQAPIQAFVGQFGAIPDPGLVVLNSLSSDMTYYPSLDGVGPAHDLRPAAWTRSPG